MNKKKKRIKKVCKQCGKEFEVIPSDKNRKFCSKDCYSHWQSKNLCEENSPNWERVKMFCKWCGEEFDTIPSQMVGGRKFCSKECYGCWQSINRSRENHWNWQGGEVHVICQECSNEFEAVPSEHRKFCSGICFHKAWGRKHSGENHPKWKGGKQKIVCEYCGGEFEAYKKTRRFCTKECRYAWVSKNLVGENNPCWDRVEIVCKWCTKKFWVTLSQIRNGKSFCSKSCYGLWQSEYCVGEVHHSWRGGISFEPYGIEWTDELKEGIRRRDDHTCAISSDVWQVGQVKFHVHHINYDKIDNRPENLITVSASCHGKTNANREYWQALLGPIARSRETEVP